MPQSKFADAPCAQIRFFALSFLPGSGEMSLNDNFARRKGASF